MSVLKSKRTTSKAEFVNTANQIYIETLNFLTRLSARYSRLLADLRRFWLERSSTMRKRPTAFFRLTSAGGVEKSSSLGARASLMALDVRLTHCYSIMSQNHRDALPTAKGKPAAF